MMKIGTKMFVGMLTAVLLFGMLSIPVSQGNVGQSGIQTQTTETELLINGDFSDGMNGWDQAITGYTALGSPTGQSTSTAGGILETGVENGYNQVHQNIEVNSTDLGFHGELKAVQFSSGGGMVSIQILLYKEKPLEWSGNPPSNPSNAPGLNPFLGQIVWYIRPSYTYTSTDTFYAEKLGTTLSNWYSVDANLHEIISICLPGVNENEVKWVTVWAQTYGQQGGLTIGDYDNFSLMELISIPPVNQPPVANAGTDQTVETNHEVQFDGSGSNDSDGTIVSYDWDFDDGTTGTGMNPTHSYISEGVYTVTLTVTDDNGATGTDTCTITVIVPATGAALSIVKEKINGPDIVETHTCYGWTLEITVNNLGGSDATDVVVHDVLPAELDLIDYMVTQGIFTYTQNGQGQMGSTSLTWEVGTLSPGNDESLTLVISTTTNPAGKQEFTSPGNYSLNDGAWLVGIDSLTGEELAAGPTPPIMVVAVDPEGDDEGEDMEEQCCVDELDQLGPEEEIGVSTFETENEPRESENGARENIEKTLKNPAGWLGTYAPLLLFTIITIGVAIEGAKLGAKKMQEKKIEELDRKLLKGEISEGAYLKEVEKLNN